jgi:hypothetical protein
MKKLKSFLLLAILAGLTIGFYSCGTDDDDDDVDPSGVPTMTFTMPQNAAFEVSRGQNVDFQFTVFANLNTKKDIEEVVFSVKYPVGNPDDTTFVPDKNEDQQFAITHTFWVPNTGLNDGDKITITITATDKDAKTAEKVFTLTVVDNSGLNVYEGVQIGAQDNPTYGSFYNTVSNMVYFINTVGGNENKVDMVYFYGATNTATLASPDNDDVFGDGPGKISSLGVHNWSVRNSTKFAKIATLTLAEWENMDQDKVQTKYLTAPQNDLGMANNLFDGSGGSQISYVPFKTNKNKYGMVKVKQITEYDGSGSIVFDMKIQK